jgi:hypothetical protein
MISAIVLSMNFAVAQDWSASGTVSSSYGWIVDEGSFGGSFGSTGVYAATTGYASAAQPVTVGTSGNFDLTVNFKVQGDNTSALFGINTIGNASDTSGEMLVGYAAENGPFGVLKGSSEFISLDAGSPTPGSSYTANVKSTDGGKTAVFTVNGKSTSLSLSDKPKSVVIYINNNGAAPSFSTSPVVNSISFTSADATATPTPSATPTTSPTPSPTKTNFALDLTAIRDFYAKQPVGHMSNQSVVYNPDGTIKQVITGNQAVTTPTATVTPPANNTTKPTATPSKAPTATATPSNATAVPPAPTKTQAPGFEIVLAAIGMISALVLITRKKK